jgi:hypothetical protein
LLSVVGIGPENWLLVRTRAFSRLKLPISGGMGPGTFALAKLLQNDEYLYKNLFL